MKTRTLIKSIISASLILFLPCSMAAKTNALPTAQPINQIVAVVNNSVITQSQLDRLVKYKQLEMAYIAKQQHQQPPSISSQQVLSQYINQTLLTQRAQTLPINMAAVNQLAQKDYQQGLSPAQRIIFTKAGFTEAQALDTIKDQILGGYAAAHLVTLSAQQTNSIIKGYTLYSISDFTANNEKQAQDIYKTLASGKKTTVPSSPINAPLAQLPPEYAFQITQTNQKIIAPFSYLGAWHVLKINGTQQPPAAALKNIFNQAKQAQLIQKLHKLAYIKIETS
jgi:hypothetical protein